MFVNKIISAFYAQESSLINGLSVLFFYQGVGLSPRTSLYIILLRFTLHASNEIQYWVIFI